MGIFSRFSDIINSNINAMLERARDPEKIIRLIIQEMEDTLVEVRSGAVRFIAERKELERRIARMQAERDDWARKAELALAKDREDLARGALKAKARLADSIEAAGRQLEEIDAALEKQNEDLGRLQAKLAETKEREKVLKTRRTAATNRLRMRGHVHDERVTDAMSRFDEVERDLDTLEGRVESYDMGATRSLEDEFADLAADSAVEDELAALKARVKAKETR